MPEQAGSGGNQVPLVPATSMTAFPARRSLVDEAYDHLVELILDIEPGARIPTDALARAWGISATPIREALVRAEARGLVQREALKGYRVAPPLPTEEFQHLMQMRLLVEPYCALRASELADDGVIRGLEAHYDSMRVAPTGPTAKDYQDYLRADIAFHEGIATASKNRYLQINLAVTDTHIHRFRRFGGEVNDSRQSLDEHYAVLDAIRKHDGEAASAAMTRHLQGVAERGREDIRTGLSA